MHFYIRPDTDWTKMKLAVYLCILSAVTALSDEQILQQFESLQKQVSQLNERLEKQQLAERQHLAEKQHQIELLQKQVARQQLEIGQPEICKCSIQSRACQKNFFQASFSLVWIPIPFGAHRL